MENTRKQFKHWDKVLDYSGKKVQIQNISFNPSKVFTDGTVKVLNERHSNQLEFTAKFKEKVFPFMDTEISGIEEFSYDVFWDKYGYMMPKKEEIKGQFTDVIKPFNLIQFWGLFYYLAPKTEGSGSNGLLGDLFDHAPKTFIRVTLPSNEKVVITMRPFTRGDFTDEWIGVQIDCVDEITLNVDNGDFTLVKIFSLAD